MDALALPLLAYYAAVILVLCIYGTHRYWIVLVYLRDRHLTANRPAPDELRSLPPVTVQLPIFNEPAVVERVIEAAGRLDYPRDRLEIQVLDDSSDETPTLARRCCRRLAERGLDVKYVHRSNREGFKAGALAAAMDSASGEFIAVFDADFVPPPDFLRRTIHEFSDPCIGMVQTRWGHLNRTTSMLTEVQAMSLDAHFVIEQLARAESGRWFNFNGTAGIWRRQCIDEAGGWQHDTLTEDTDLSYRAQLAGWRFRYLPHVICQAEIPPTVGALMTQQHRWNKGLIQNAIKLLPRILKSEAPLKTKIEAWFHLTSPVPYVFILLLSLLVIPAMFVSLPLDGVRQSLAFGIGLACLGLGTLAACVFYLVSQKAQGFSVWRTIAHLPALMAVGIGISVTNTRAVLEALFGVRSPFVRTPKYDHEERSATDPAVAAARRRWRVPQGVPELVLGLLMLLGAVVASLQPVSLVGVPFLLLFAWGFLLIGVPLTWERVKERKLPALAAVAGSPRVTAAKE